jgi:hypothetical protein
MKFPFCLLLIFSQSDVVASLLYTLDDEHLHGGKMMESLDSAASSPLALELTIVSATHLRNRDHFGNSDPFVIANITNKGSMTMKTHKVIDTGEPVWNSVFELGDFRAGDRIEFEVWDFDVGVNDDFLGRAFFNPSCADPGTKTLELSERGSLKVMIKCVDARESMLLDMVKIARYVYSLNPHAGPWDMVANFTENNDKVAVYRKGNECTLAFSGTDDFDNVKTDLNILSTEACGFEMHKGFFDALNKTLLDPKWMADVEPYLASDKCSDGVNAAGHSLGGALAAIFAVCVNQKKGFIPGDKFVVKGVYTIGAPGVAKQQLRNMQNNSGCFNGARIFVEDPNTFDPVPYVADVANFVHPQLRAIQLHETTSGKKLSLNEFDCRSETARKGLTGGIPNPVLHSSDLYLARMHELWKS